MGEKIKCHFNLFEEGRVYTGHHRNYILESATKTCYDPATREGLQLREKLGYLGHGRREMAGKLVLPEVGTIKLPDGTSMVVENIPACCTTAFEIDKNGNVTHEQELADNDQGLKVSGLNKSRIGGFSWACGGVDGGKMGATRLAGFEGFDYVYQPGFAKNRGYVLESAAGNDLILENVCKATGMKDAEAELFLRQWISTSIFENANLIERIESAAIYEDALREEVEKNRQTLEAVTSQLETEKTAQESRRKIILECASKSVIAIPDRVVNSLLSMASENDFYELVSFFESAKQINLNGLPIGTQQKVIIPSKGLVKTPEYGSAAAAPDFEEPRF